MSLRACPYCESSDTRTDYSCGGDEILRCPACDLIFRASRGDEEAWVRYYRQQYHQDYGEEQEGPQREVIYGEALDVIGSLVPTGTLFDIGAGSGAFLAIASSRGWNVSGQEISSGGCITAREKYGIELIQADIPDLRLEPDTYHAITLVNVFDHLVEPWPLLERIYRALKPGGVLYVRVPNGGLHRNGLRLSMALPCAFLRDRVRRYFVLHRYHFTPDFVRRALVRAGFGSVIVQPSVPSRGIPYTGLRQDERCTVLALKKLVPRIASVAYGISGGRLMWSPSMNVCAIKDGKPDLRGRVIV